MVQSESFCVWVPIRNIVSKNISVSDDVYERLSMEKGDRSFSEVIADALDGGSRLEDVVGQGIFEPGTYEAVKEEARRLSEPALERMDDETA